VILKPQICFQLLSYHGVALDDEQTIASSGISDLATIDVLARVCGGKVHGSLARAGKVKGQTPKVTNCLQLTVVLVLMTL